MTDTTYAFGDRVTFTRSLHRRTTSRRVISPSEWGNQHRYCSYKEWTIERWLGDNPPEDPRDGIVIGKRVLANGYVYYDQGEGTTFGPDQHLTAYLIAYDLNRKPVYVLPEHITPATTQENTNDQ